MVRSATSRGSIGGTGGGKRFQYGPKSLAPLSQRPYDMTKEQNDAIVKAQVEAHFAPKPALPPREKVPEEKIDHFIRMARPPAPKPVDSDYERQIRKARQAQQQAGSRSSSSQAAGQKCGKIVPQLGEQAA